MKPAGQGRRALPVLAVVVLAIHLLLLRAAPRTVQAPDPLAGRALVTRTITTPRAAPSAPAAVAAADPARSAAVTAQPAKRLPPKSATPLNATPLNPAALPIAPARAMPAAAAAAVAEPALATHRAPTPAAAMRETGSFTIPGSVRLHYKVTAQRRGQASEMDAELVWRHDGSAYDALMEVRSAIGAVRTQRSAGRIGTDGLAPLRFSDKARTEEAAHFERAEAKVIFSSNRPHAELLPGAQDRLSVLLQLSAMIAGNPGRFTSGTIIAVQTAGTREAEPWEFIVETEEQLQLPGGAVSARKLTRHPRKEFDSRVELWLAPGMDYVPVRLRLTHPNGDWQDQQWSSTDRG